jgi:hypothetical protein
MQRIYARVSNTETLFFPIRLARYLKLSTPVGANRTYCNASGLYDVYVAGKLA